MGRGEQRIFAARHIAAGGLHRHILVTQHHARQGLDLDIQDRSTLDLGEITDLRLGEPDIGNILWGELRKAVVDLGLAEAIILAIPAVELDREFSHGFVAAGLDLQKRSLDDLADLPVLVGNSGRFSPLLEPLSHISPPANFGHR
jgi:hypothetical protein